MPVLVVDVANVMGSRPDGWWRDRSGAATRLMATLAPLVATDVVVPDSGSPGDDSVATVRLDRVVAVIEGRAQTAIGPPGIEVVRAPADGDSSIVEVARQVVADGETPLVVTADRGLRERLPTGSLVAGPKWLLAQT
jgi:hypothetical protein